MLKYPSPKTATHLGIFALCLFLLGGLIACAPRPPKTEIAPIDPDNYGQLVDLAEPINIALLVPLNATDPNIHALATNLVEAAELARDSFPNLNLKLNIFITEGTTEGAIKAAQDARQFESQIIVGPLFSTSATAVKRELTDANINILSFSNNGRIADKNLFILGTTFENRANRVMGYAATRGYHRFASVSAQNAGGVQTATAVASAAQTLGLEYSGDFTYPFSPKGIAEASPFIINQVIATATGAIVLSADSDGGLSQLGQALSREGLDDARVKVLGTTRWDIPASNLSTPGLNSGWFALPDTFATSTFNQRFLDKYHRAPHPLAGLAYDAIIAIGTGLQNGDTGALMRNALTRRQGFIGAAGLFILQKDGTNRRALAIGEPTGTSFRVISPAPQNVNSPVF
ncbi:MAG: penicillin-binding protein activator [Candidatus Halichondribacter symbioticus]